MARVGYYGGVIRWQITMTTGIELVLIETDGAPWGCVAPLTTQWRDIRIPLKKLRFFKHWRHLKNRGGRNDRLNLQNLIAVNPCFSAWLYPDHERKPPAIDIEVVGLVR